MSFIFPNLEICSHCNQYIRIWPSNLKINNILFQNGVSKMAGENCKILEANKMHPTVIIFLILIPPSKSNQGKLNQIQSLHHLNVFLEETA